jgi:hypothetical protein
MTTTYSMTIFGSAVEKRINWKTFVAELLRMQL